MNLTPLQIVGIIILFNSTLIGGASQLGDLSLSPGIVKAILAVATLGNGFLGGLVTMFSSQGSMVRTVAAMPGVERVAINAQANQTLATAAVDPDQPKIGPTTPDVRNVLRDTAKGALLIALILPALLLMLLQPLAAQTPKPRPVAPNPIDQFNQKLKDDFTHDTGVKATGDLPFDLLRALDAKLLPDLQYALKLAQATGSNVTAPCYQAWIDMINTQQTAVQQKNPDGTTTDIPIPDPHLVTDFERMVELRNALQPESNFMTKCSPVANLIKQDVISFMGKVISGGAGLATLVPGL